MIKFICFFGYFNIPIFIGIVLWKYEVSLLASIIIWFTLTMLLDTIWTFLIFSIDRMVFKKTILNKLMNQFWENENDNLLRRSKRDLNSWKRFGTKRRITNW